MKKSAILSALSIGILSISMAFATPQQAVEQVRGNAVEVLNILKRANGSNDAQVRRQAENYAIPYFDFELMTRRAVGAPWNQATAAQKQALTQEFKTLLIRTYSVMMLKFKDAHVDVKNTPLVRNNGKEVVVSTEISVKGSAPVKIDFTTYNKAGKYRVYDVAVEKSSLVTVYRNQFGDIIKRKGFDGLIAELKEKNSGKK